jgi:hypothetical protein
MVIVQVVDCPTFQATCGFDHCYTMGVKQGGQMCANVVELSCKLVIMSVVMESAKIPWEDIAQLKRCGNLTTYRRAGTPAVMWKPL